MESSWINLLIQVPLVGIFVWYALATNKNYDERAAKRDADWRDFLDKQRELTDRSIESMTQQMGKMTDTLAEVHRTVISSQPASRRKRTAD